MANGEKICEHCGAICKTSDEYCKSCWKSFPKESVPEEAVLEGNNTADWRTFIDKNSDYYIEKFKKYEGKKFFLSLNFPAILFGLSWFFYRRMFKKGILLYLLEAAVSIIISVVFILSFLPSFHQYADANKDLKEYKASGKETHYIDEDGFLAEVPEVSEIYTRLGAADKSLTNMQGLMTILSLAACILIRLSANCIYRDHVMKYMGTQVTGGRSIPAFFGSLIVGNLLEFGINVLVILIFGLLLVGIPIVLF